jgi:hypothetical protein
MGQFEQDWLELGRRVACSLQLPASPEPPPRRSRRGRGSAERLGVFLEAGLVLLVVELWWIQHPVDRLDSVMMLGLC